MADTAHGAGAPSSSDAQTTGNAQGVAQTGAGNNNAAEGILPESRVRTFFAILNIK